MRGLTPAEYEALADVAHDERFICETDATVTADDLGPDVDGPTVDLLEQRGSGGKFGAEIVIRSAT